MKAMLKDHDRILKGNGQKGLVQIIPSLASTVENLDETVGALRTAVSGLNKFQDDIVAETKVKAKAEAKRQVRNVNYQWAITTLIVLVMYLLDKLHLL